MISASVVAVTNAATLLAEAGVDRVSVTATNTAGVTLYLGGPGVTTGAGAEWPAGANLSVDLLPGDELYAIAAAAGPYNVRPLVVNR